GKNSRVVLDVVDAVHARRRLGYRRPDARLLAPRAAPRGLHLPPCFFRPREQGVDFALHGRDFARIEHARSQHVALLAPGVQVKHAAMVSLTAVRTPPWARSAQDSSSLTS